MNTKILDEKFQALLAEVEEENINDLKKRAKKINLVMAEERKIAYLQDLKNFGLNADLIEAKENENNEAAVKWVNSVRPALIMGGGEEQVAQRLSMDEMRFSKESSLVPDGFSMLSPSSVTTISSESLKQDWIGNPNVSKYWIKAWGGGWGCTGGVGEIERNIDWWFLYKAPTNKFYGIIPYVNLHGFYIVRADDKWYNCKYAKGKIDIRVNVYQYNWKGENSWTVHNVENDNISVNDRIDTQRSVYHTALLGADYAWIRVRVNLYGYAKGDGSYTELNFDAGTANYLSVPWLWIG